MGGKYAIRRRELGLEEMPEQEEEPEENWDAVDSEADSTDAGMMKG